MRTLAQFAEQEQVNYVYLAEGLIRIGSCRWEEIKDLTPEDLAEDEEDLYKV